ncbi:Uncharacterized protein APZ42_025092 [Daphnia magna]|uniref:RNA-directed DNA polymerase n=1 Tax=Daphnia magna TaxID=35525 RepID=A0A164TGW7_9CRUS|nr:Uncharacterized protein APZ42_025092 [Daphnia magna]
MPKRTNPWLPICPRDPSRRLHPLQELSNVPVETLPTPASSLESGTSFVGEALNFEGSILKDHLTEEADSQGESVKTARDSDSDSETEVVLTAASPVVPVGGLQFIVPSGHILQPQRQAMAAVKKFISPPIFRAPVLAHPNYDLPMEILPDACGIGIGGVLAQRIDGVERSVAYASRLLSKSETNYSITEKECFALVWCLTKFRCYVWRCQVKVITDHQALCWLMSKRDLYGRLARWSLSLQENDITIVYRSEETHDNADLLSRNPLQQIEETEDDRCFIVAAIGPNAVNILSPEADCSIVSNQRAHRYWNEKISKLEDGKERVKNFLLCNAKLYEETFKDGKNYIRLCVPVERGKRILQAYHDDIVSGHLGIKRILHKICSQFFWPKMNLDITRYLEDTFEALNQILQWRHQLADSLNIGFCQLADGNLAPKIVSPARFNAVIKNVNRQLPRGWSISSDELWVAYRESTVTVASLEHHFRNFIQVLIFDHAQQYKLFQILNLPGAADNRTHSVSFSNLPNFLAVAADLETFLELSKDDVWECKKICRTLCKFHTGNSKRNARKSYAIAAFMNYVPRIKKQCRSNQWAFSATVPRDIVFSCPPNVGQPPLRTLTLRLANHVAPPHPASNTGIRPPVPCVNEDTVQPKGVVFTNPPLVWGGCKQTASSTAWDVFRGGVTTLPVPQWGYNTNPNNPFAPSGQPSQSIAPSPPPGFVASTPVNLKSSGQQNPHWLNTQTPTTPHPGTPKPSCPLTVTSVTVDDKIRRAQHEQAILAFSSVAIFCDRQSSGRFDDWAAHLEATLDLANFEEARKLRLMRSKLYGETVVEFDNFKLDNPIRVKEYSAVKERLLKLFHSTKTSSQRSVEFHNMKREPEENMRRYANRIRKPI